MIIGQIDSYMKLCLQTWIFCESCIYSEISTSTPRRELVKECHDCALACFALVAKLANNQLEIGEQAFRCIIHCRQCQETCAKYAETEDIRCCGEICKRCAEQIKGIALEFNLN